MTAWHCHSVQLVGAGDFCHQMLELSPSPSVSLHDGICPLQAQSGKYYLGTEKLAMLTSILNPTWWGKSGSEGISHVVRCRWKEDGVNDTFIFWREEMVNYVRLYVKQRGGRKWYWSWHTGTLIREMLTFCIKSLSMKIEEMRFGGILIYIYIYVLEKNIFSHCWRLVSFPLLGDHWRKWDFSA